jgi:hypothetical protein
MQRLLFQTNLKTINFFICIIVYSDTINKNFGNESYFKFSHGNFNYRGESQIRIDDVEAESCLNVTAISPNNLRLIIICRLGTCVRSNTEHDKTSVSHHSISK